MAKTAKTAKKRTARAKKSGPPVVCGCPFGTRARVRSGQLACETPNGATRSASCSIGPRSYRIGPARARTDERAGKSAGLILEAPGLTYSTTSAPCMSDRKGCPIQLVARGGRQHLRFCRTAGSGEPGHMVAVANPSAARKLAAEACAQWKADGGKFTASNPAVVAASGALGGYRRR